MWWTKFQIITDIVRILDKTTNTLTEIAKVLKDHDERLKKLERVEKN